MHRVGVVVSLLLCACVPSMVRAPREIPASGAVDCTDSLEMPVAAMVVAVASAGLAAYGLAHIDFAARNGGIIWLPVAGTLALDELEAAATGFGYASECRDAKRRGAEIARRHEEKVRARAEAGRMWKQAAAAARADDCATVRALDPQIRALDVELHDVVFARDVAIGRCLAGAP